MKTYRRHRCAKTHRTPRTLATCMFPRALWIMGDGPYALLAWCGQLTVTLHPTRERAEAAQHLLDKTGCGGRCTNRHEVVALDLLCQEDGR